MSNTKTTGTNWTGGRGYPERKNKHEVENMKDEINTARKECSTTKKDEENEK